MNKINLNNVTLAKNIKREIERLNQDIDLKIIKGLPYKAEARRHRFLMIQFDKLYDRRKVGWFRKAATAFASFML